MQKQLFGLLIIILSLANLPAKDFRIMTEFYPPYNYDQNGTLKGISVEIFKKLQKKVGNSDPIELISWKDAYNEVLTKKNQILFSMSRTPARENLFKWVGPLSIDYVQFMKLLENDIRVSSLEDAKKYRICHSKNDPIRDFLRAKGFKKFVTVNEKKECFKKIISGDADLMGGLSTTFFLMMKRYGFEPEMFEETKVYYQQQKLYIAFSRNTPDETIQLWQKELDQLKTDELKVNSINEAYRDFRVHKEAGNAHVCDNIKVYGSDDWVPVAYNDIGNNRPSGIAFDVMRELTRRTGIATDLITNQPWKRGLKMVEIGHIDALSGIYHNEERENFFLFSEPFYNDDISVFVRKEDAFEFNSLEDLIGKTGARPDGGSYGTEFDKFDAEHLKMIRVKSGSVAIHHLLNGNIDFTVLGKLDGLSDIRQLKAEDKIIALPNAISSNPVHMVFSKNSKCGLLIDEVNRHIRSMKHDGTLKNIVSRYMFK